MSFEKYENLMINNLCSYQVSIKNNSGIIIKIILVECWFRNIRKNVQFRLISLLAYVYKKKINKTTNPKNVNRV